MAREDLYHTSVSSWVSDTCFFKILAFINFNECTTLSRLILSHFSFQLLCVKPSYILYWFHLYKYFAWVSVCLFVSNKRQNGWTDRAQILCWTSCDPRKGLWMIKIAKICVLKFFIFEKFWKRAKIIMKSTNFFLFLFYTVQRARRCSWMKPQLKVKIEKRLKAPLEPSLLYFLICTRTFV